MKSSGGQHFIVLDQLRGLAAYLVVMWHFLHSASGLAAPVPYEGAPLLALIDEGHTGVALFMTLSGYLFARLCEGRRVHYGAFLANRALRLFPLLFAVFALIAAMALLRFGTLGGLPMVIAQGFILPVWPNGGWSIAVELQFYLLLPFLLLATRKHRSFLLWCVLAMIAFRTAIWWWLGTIQQGSYWTIIGRFDQFALGILAWIWREELAARVRFLPLVALGFCAFYWWFDWMGGFRDFAGEGYPNRNPVWIVLPTLEGAFYGAIIAMCDRAYPGGLPLPRRLGTLIAAAGTYSYSIYLLHFFAVDTVAMAVHRHIDISGFYPAVLAGTVFFIAMIAVGRISYRCIEEPFLRFRLPYLDRVAKREAALA